MVCRKASIKGNDVKKTCSDLLRNELGFSYIEIIYSLSILVIILTLLVSLISITNQEKERIQNTILLQHSYQIGYSYLKSRIVTADSLSGGGLAPLYIRKDDSLEIFSVFGSDVNRNIYNTQGVIKVFLFVDNLTFEVLPNQKGVRIIGILKKGDTTIKFDDVILREVQK